MRDSATAQRSRQDNAQASFDLMPTHSPLFFITTDENRRAIEDDDFPFEVLSDIAEIESWRKEVSRPLTHIHKWWAQRLGSVFRAIVIATFAPSGSDVLKLFYSPARLQEAVVFDPFMGSGTTIVEALKLGARAIGRDINPVAWFLVRNALARHDRSAVLDTFAAIKRDVEIVLRPYYTTELEDGSKAAVLYYFWVKTIDCPNCLRSVDLRSSHIFAQHAYAKQYPEAHAVCPHCGEVNPTRSDAHSVTCQACRHSYDPRLGNARGTKACCPHCSNEFPIAKTVRANARPPAHRLYAKLVLLPGGKKVYLRATDADCQLYAAAERALELRTNPYPIVSIAPGYNTNQALGYNYRHWHEMFNARQLLSLSILGERIAAIKEPALRDLFLCLLSGVLEFNNMFASFKGEGTGAVRHMFYHHILKPERVPLEANLWGTPKSSGSFSTLFESRIVRALNYAADPFELRLGKKNGKHASEKVYGLSQAIGYDIVANYKSFGDSKPVYLSCADSSRTDISDGSVDAVITDPPFFDNVHYSQLADFFYVWQRHFLGYNGNHALSSTRQPTEVQHSDSEDFTARLCSVWKEAHRVLKADGLLVFTYHHSRHEGWSSILKALMDADFVIVAVHPVKSEMSVATPKQQAKEPIDLDIIMVCRKRIVGRPSETHSPSRAAEQQIRRLRVSGRTLSRNDVRIIVMSQLLRTLSQSEASGMALERLRQQQVEIEATITRLASPQVAGESFLGGSVA